MSGSGGISDTFAAVAEQVAEQQERASLADIDEALSSAEAAEFTGAPPVRINGATEPLAGAGESQAYDDYFFPGREEILATDDIVVQELAVPEWDQRRPDGTIRRARLRVRSLTGKERDEFEAESISRKGRKVDVNMQNMRARLVARSVVDDKGALVFSERDVILLGQKNASAIDRIFSVAQGLSGLTDRDLEDLTGNLESDPNGASGSH